MFGRLQGQSHPADNATMGGSYAYGEIDDPHDPAWSGHAPPEPEAPMPAVDARLLTVVAAIALLVAAWAALPPQQDERAPAVQAAEPARAAAAPASLPVVEPHEPIPATAPAPLPTATQARPATSAAAPAAARSRRPAATTTAAPRRHHFAPGTSSTFVMRPAAVGGAVAPPSAFGRPGAVSGKAAGLSPSLSAGLEGLAVLMGKPLTIISGTRSHAEQAELYRRYQAGTGNMAARPGTSRHETGDAADVYVNGVALADVPGARALAESIGLGFPVPGEAWHVERMPTGPR